MLTRRKIWIDGALVPFGQAKVHLLSHSFGRGSALFEVMSVHPTEPGPAVFRLDDHLDRLFRSAELCHMKLPLSARSIKTAVKAAVKANAVGLGVVKIIAYYDGVELEVVPRSPVVKVAVVALDLKRDLSAERFNKALRRPAEVTISPWRKCDPTAVPIEAKCAANYLGGMVAKMGAIEQGFTSPVLLDSDGYLAEGATESLFIVKDNVLKTPALGNILSGITRKTVLELARDINLTAVEKKLKPQELFEADEAFFTSSLVKTWPIRRVENLIFSIVPGQVTRLLDKVIEKIVAYQAKDYRKWLTIVR